MGLIITGGILLQMGVRLTFEENKVKSLKFFRYEQKVVYEGIDLDNDPSSLEGKDALDFLIELARQRKTT